MGAVQTRVHACQLSSATRPPSRSACAAAVLVTFGGKYSNE